MRSICRRPESDRVCAAEAALSMILQTPRLILREMDLHDLPFLAEVLGDPEVMRFWPAPLTREQSLEWIKKQQDRYVRHGCGYWLAIEKATNQPVGQVGVMIIQLNGVDEAALGYIIHRPFWRRGFAYEASRACVEFVFETLQRPRAVSLIRPHNTPSLQIAIKLGMQPIGTTIHADLEHLIYAKTRPMG